MAMDSKAQELADYLVYRFHILSTESSTRRLIVGISGIPASGKSTLAQLIVKHTNNRLNTSGRLPKTEAVLVGLDGWHLSRVQLDAFPDPTTAHARRGTHWTFDGEGYSAFVHSLREELSTNAVNMIITAPSFDHAVKDPTPNAISIHPYHRIVVIEGLYTYLSVDPWKAAGELLDERWFIETGFQEATERLVKRHVVSGVTRDLEEAILRARENDMPNGIFI